MLNIANKRITILGAQKSGVALAALVRSLGGKPSISELNKEENFDESVIDSIKKVSEKYEFAGHTQSFIEDSDLVVLSPGVSIFSEAVRWAKDKNIPVVGEIEFAYQFCHKPVIAVTGSNGKTTVVTLIHEILTEAGLRSCLCGNIGHPFSEKIKEIEKVDYVVLEVSSFQLESVLDPKQSEHKQEGNILNGFEGFKPFIAVILNFNENHLDRHQDLKEYLMAKARIFLNQDKGDYAILNDQDPFMKEILEGVNANIIGFLSETKPLEDIQNPNYLVVCEVAKILQVDKKICKNVFSKFVGVEHRMEWVRKYQGVDYINDSKATTAQSCLWALKHVDQPIILICGGRDKNIDYSVVGDQVKEKVKNVFVIGEASQKIARALNNIVPVEHCDSLDHAVQEASHIAKEGDCILFSPMCASFDMFKNFEERGMIFKDIVNSLEG